MVKSMYNIIGKIGWIGFSYFKCFELNTCKNSFEVKIWKWKQFFIRSQKIHSATHTKSCVYAMLYIVKVCKQL